MEPLPVDPGWRERVEDTIRRLQQDAHRYQGTANAIFPSLALRGWRAELRTIEEAERYWGEVTNAAEV